MLLDRPADIPASSASPAVGVRAFLIADVRGYTRFTQEHGDDAAARLAARFADLVREGLAGSDGELVDLRGDEVALAFGSVRQALRTALALQNRFAHEMAADPTLPLRVGMGVDAGEAVAVAGGYRGMALNLAARLCAAASGGEVLVSEAVAHLAGTVEGLACLDRGLLTLKGLEAPVRALQALPTPFVAVVAAPEERTTVARLRADLRGAGVACWDATPVLDGEGGGGLRAGVRACRAVLLVEAPGTGRARPVAAALEVAGVYRRPVVTIWLDGTAGTDATKTDVSVAREGTLDLRGERYAVALPRLVGLLEQGEEFVIAPTEFAEPGAPGDPVVADLVAPVAARNPYKGLRAFREDDVGDFFGRAALVADLVAAVDAYTQPGAARFLAVVGPSGSGKSSVVLAGLLPPLRRGVVPGSERWVYLVPLVPGAHPLEALAVTLNNALPGSLLSALQADLAASARGLHLLASRLSTAPDGRVVLVVDQAEELFTLTAGEDERRHFIDLLVTAASEPRGPLLVVLTLRADFYDRPLAYPALGRLMATQSTAVLPLGPVELRAAIEGPARLPDVGLRFQGDLVGDLLYEVRDQAGALPLLQFTLDQLYERRDGRTLTEAAYQELGGVRGALARQAEATYLGLPAEEERGLARALFLRLIEPGTSAQEATRRRAPLGEMELTEAARTERMRAVAEVFIAARLLTAQERAGTRTLEVSHEALIREWARLGEWLQDAREDVRLQGQLSADAAEWARRDRPADSLLRGTVLAEARGWAARNTPSALEAAFLEEATAEAERQAEQEQERQSRELALTRRAATRLRALAGVLAVFLLAAAGLTTFALNQATQAQHAQRQATTNARTAIAERNIALSRQLASQAITRLDGQYDLALLLSLEARRVANTVEARDSMLRALQLAPPGLIAFLQGHTLAVGSLSLSRDGKLLASGSTDGTIRLWDMVHRRPFTSPFVSYGGAVSSVALSPDGRIVAAASDDQVIRLWSVARHRLLGAPLQGPTSMISSIAFSPDGKTLAAGSWDKTVWLWDVAHRRLRPEARLLGHTDYVLAVAFSPDGKILATGGADDAVRLWDVATGLPLSPRSGLSGILTGHTSPVTGLAFSPDGRMLASSGSDRTIRLWDVARQQPPGSPLRGHTDFVLSVAFSADGRTLASGSLDGTVRLWDVRRRRALGPALVSHTGEVDAVVFSPHGLLASATTDGSIAIWDVRHREPPSRILNGRLGTVHDNSTGAGEVTSVAFSPDSHWLAASIVTGDVQLWDMRQGILRRSFASDAIVSSVAFSPDGKLLAVAGYSSGLQLWDPASGHLLISGSTQSIVTSAAFSVDGRLLVTGAWDGTVQFWTIGRHPTVTLQPLGAPLAGHAGGVRDVAFSHDNKILASTGEEGAIQLWDVVHHRPLGRPLVGHTANVSGIAFSPTGNVLASASDDTTVRLWDITHRRPLGPPLIGHTDYVDTVAFSPDGAVLASGGGDNTVRLWDVTSRQPLGTPLRGYVDYVMSLAFSRTGHTLATGSADGTLRLWDLDLTSWPQRACRIANRNLTRQEWRQYLGDEPYHTTCPELPAGS